ncbi:AhpD family alkylhydroperoxidase [Bradyrhizobium sp. USDA 4515]
MTVRLDPLAAAPKIMKIWFDASVAISSSLEPKLAELVKIRASEINGCANCINLHTTFARDEG